MGKRLKECRTACGLSQEQLIDAVMKLPDNRGKERSEKQISYLENGTRPISVEYASLLAQVLNVRVEYLLLKDDFRTEHEMFEDGLRGLHNAYSNIVNLIKLHGYDIQEVDLSESRGRRTFLQTGVDITAEVWYIICCRYLPVWWNW
jgi:DNA-binding helix-turn-helix protein